MKPRFDLSHYDAAVFDLDGTVWLGPGHPIPGAREFLDRCRDLGHAIAFATNAPRPPTPLIEQLVADGLARPGEPVITSAVVITRTLVRRGVTRAGALVPEPMADWMRAAGIEVVAPADHDIASFGEIGPGRALVMAASRQVTIGDIERLGRLAAAGHPVYAVSKDPGYPVAGGIEPGGAALLAALRTLYDVDATILGKPSTDYAAAVAEAVGGAERRIVMFGDSAHADMGIAHELGADGVLLTAHSMRPIEPTGPMPHYTAATLADAPLPIESEVT